MGEEKQIKKPVFQTDYIAVWDNTSREGARYLTLAIKKDCKINVYTEPQKPREVVAKPKPGQQAFVD